MSQYSIEQSVKELNCMIQSAQFMEAFEKFYDDEVIMQENERAPMIGKRANREREKEFFSKASGYENGIVEAVTTGENTSAVVWKLEYDHKDMGHLRYKQVSVQQWRDGKIVKEQFFYGS